MVAKVSEKNRLRLEHDSVEGYCGECKFCVAARKGVSFDLVFLFTVWMDPRLRKNKARISRSIGTLKRISDLDGLLLDGEDPIISEISSLYEAIIVKLERLEKRYPTPAGGHTFWPIEYLMARYREIFRDEETPSYVAFDIDGKMLNGTKQAQFIYDTWKLARAELIETGAHNTYASHGDRRIKTLPDLTGDFSRTMSTVADERNGKLRASEEIFSLKGDHEKILGF